MDFPKTIARRFWGVWVNLAKSQLFVGRVRQEKSVRFRYKTLMASYAVRPGPDSGVAVAVEASEERKREKVVGEIGKIGQA